MFYPTQTGGIASLMSNPYRQPMTPMAPRPMAPPQMAPQMPSPMMRPSPQAQQAQPQMQPFGMMQGFGAPSQGHPLPQQAYMQLPAAMPSPAAVGQGQNSAYGMYGGGQVRRMQQGGLAYIPLMYRGV